LCQIHGGQSSPKIFPKREIQGGQCPPKLFPAWAHAHPAHLVPTPLFYTKWYMSASTVIYIMAILAILETVFMARRLTDAMRIKTTTLDK